MNGFHWNKIPDPHPLIERGKYREIAKPTWQIRSGNPAVQQMPYNFKLQFENPEIISDGTLIYQAAQPESLYEMQQYIEYVLGQGGLPNFINEETNLKSVKFNSYLESGNLNKVFELYQDEYNLFMTADTNTKGQTRWFHFSVKNMKKGKSVRFNICNFHKPVQLFRKGLQPVYLSTTEKKLKNSDWKSIKEPVEFYRNSSLSDPVKKLYMYTLSFVFTFEYEEDEVFFALASPYTYTRLQQFLSSIQSSIDPTKHIYRQEELCKSVAGLSVPKVTLTCHKTIGQELSKRKAIIITCRVHPSETTGSWVMEGILRYLISPAAMDLLSSYIFYIVPMLNPDGVVYGNSRCGLMGVDLNRRWENPSPLVQPTIYSCKELIRGISKRREILMFCDLHSHSKKFNSFIYGCNTAANGGFTSWTKVRLLPRVIARRCSLFSYADCRFMVKPDKQGTGRVVVWKEFSITNSFTLETSFLGYRIGEIHKEFNVEDFNCIGKEAMKAIIEYNGLLKSIAFELKINGGWLKPIRLKQLTGVLAQDKIEKWYEESKKKQKNFILRSKVKPPDLPDWRDFFTDSELRAAYQRISAGEDELEPSSGSDSDPSCDNIEEVKIEEKTEKIKPVIKTEDSVLRVSENVSKAKISRSYYERKNIQSKKKPRSSEQSFYPHTSRKNLNVLDNTIRPQTSSKLISYKDTRSGRTTPGLSPIIFKTFRRNFGFYQMLSTKSQMAHGSLEIMCTKLLTKGKYNK